MKSKLNPNQKLCIVAKANCYGLGTKLIKFIEAESDYVAVSSAEEFFDVKKFTSKPIIILDPIFDLEKLSKLIGAGAELTVSNRANLERLVLALGTKNARVHLATNTGMNRFGEADLGEIKELLLKIKKTQNVKLIGVFSHFFEANNEKFAKIQYDRFEKIQALVKNIMGDDVLFHLSNSDAVTSLNGFDMARVGMKIYTDERFETLRLSAKVLEIQHLAVGDVAGYSAVFVAKRPTTLAVVGIGYGDGLHRNIVNKGRVLVNGKFAKIVAVCMDSILIDVTGIKVQIDDEVVIIGRSGEKQIFVCDVAKWCDTIGYEIITSIQSRVSRVIEE